MKVNTNIATTKSTAPHVPIPPFLAGLEDRRQMSRLLKITQMGHVLRDFQFPADPLAIGDDQPDHAQREQDATAEAEQEERHARESTTM